jgi:hypothetical protein
MEHQALVTFVVVCVTMTVHEHPLMFMVHKDMKRHHNFKMWDKLGVNVFYFLKNGRDVIEIWYVVQFLKSNCWEKGPFFL